jgi:hypothetical protein
MLRISLLGTSLFLLGILIPPSQAAERLTSCKVGDRVQDDLGGKGTVSYVNADGSCGFRYDNSGLVNTYPPSALQRVGSSGINAASPSVLLPGTYECFAGSDYTFTDIIIRNGATYSDNKGVAGEYKFDRSTQLIKFWSGTFAGNYAKYLRPGRIGLSSKPDTFFATTCDLKH